MEKAILLALLASICTATSSVCQRLGARDSQSSGLDVWLVFRLARRPIWLLGIASMILGFVFQVTALHYGALALVQPILALELLFVFGYMAFLGSRRVRGRDWLAAAAMSAGLALFLLAASPSGGRQHAPTSLWVLAGLATLAVVVAGLAVASRLRHRSPASVPQRAAILGALTGVSWYVLLVAGAASLLLASHALAAGPLAASQPGFTILDPLAASLLGLFIFGEHFQAATEDLAIEALALALLVSGVSALSHSHLINGEEDAQPAGEPGDARAIQQNPSTG